MTVGGATEALAARTAAPSPRRASSPIVAIVDADTGKLAEPPDFLARGFVHDETTFDAAVPLIEKALDRGRQEGIGIALSSSS